MSSALTVMPLPAPMLSVVVPPSETLPPLSKPLPALTVSDELASWPLVMPAVPEMSVEVIVPFTISVESISVPSAAAIVIVSVVPLLVIVTPVPFASVSVSVVVSALGLLASGVAIVVKTFCSSLVVLPSTSLVR